MSQASCPVWQQVLLFKDCLYNTGRIANSANPGQTAFKSESTLFTQAPLFLQYFGSFLKTSRNKFPVLNIIQKKMKVVGCMLRKSK